MARTVATRKRDIRHNCTRADVKELRRHSKNKTSVKTTLEHLSVAQVPSDKRPACSESRSATAALNQGERERSRVLPSSMSTSSNKSTRNTSALVRGLS